MGVRGIKAPSFLWAVFQTGFSIPRFRKAGSKNFGRQKIYRAVTQPGESVVK
ncbi:hypothetical protein HMPREF0262_01423 [Clostridium sp. ATCC 29733]|nr:hypothetical protein HMPREF0262_01423 [Clostridium sp. ATCC 29733]